MDLTRLLVQDNNDNDNYKNSNNSNDNKNNDDDNNNNDNDKIIVMIIIVIIIIMTMIKITITVIIIIIIIIILNWWPFVKGIHLWLVDSPHKIWVMWKGLPYHAIIMCSDHQQQVFSKFATFSCWISSLRWKVADEKFRWKVISCLYFKLFICTETPEVAENHSKKVCLTHSGASVTNAKSLLAKSF